MGERMVDVAAAFPGIDQGRAPGEKMGVAVVEESGEQIMEI
jgi:hypothetical protein